MEQMEVPVPRGNGLCWNEDCACGDVEIPRGGGYLYVSKKLVEFRRDCLGSLEAQLKLARMVFPPGEFPISQYVLWPVLMCEQGARQRGLDMDVAAEDARRFWETGLVPMRPTPLAGQAAEDGHGS